MNKKPIFKSKVIQDEFTKVASIAFDYEFTGESVFEGWNKPLIPNEFKIGLILGPSGSGKSLLLKEFGVEETLEWDKSKAIISHFETPEDGINRLSSVGLNSIPSWCKPFQVLSNGEQFRASLARKLKDNAVIDEFTSVVDRNVAKSASNAIYRFIQNNDIKNVVFASCHYDILEWLRPDWYFDTSTGTFYDGRLLRRPNITIKVYPCKRSIWALFKKHHYLNTKLNSACRSYIATANFGDGEIIVGFSSSLSLPSGTLKNAFREHRTVVLPDFQGMGIGPKLSDIIAQIHIDEGKRYYSRTAHIRFGKYRNNSPLWRATCQNRKLRDDVSRGKMTGPRFNNWDVDDERICFSHEYIGERKTKVKENLFDELFGY